MRVSCIDNIPAEYVQAVPLSHLMMRRRSEHHHGNNIAFTLHCSSGLALEDVGVGNVSPHTSLLFPRPYIAQAQLLLISFLFLLPADC